jgi:DnaJ-class molecular chaperone
MRKPTQEDLYRSLGVRPSATAEELKAAYRAAIKKVHPDVNDGRPEATREAQRLNAAYEILADPASRAAYDRALRAKAARRRRRRRAQAARRDALRAKSGRRTADAGSYAEVGEALAQEWKPEDPLGQALLRLGGIILDRYFSQRGR